MSKKPFSEALDEWKRDNRYAIEEDCGPEFYDDLEAGPTPAERSSAQDNGTTYQK